ncbi:MAG: formylglycine-generating enzyme family protein, partial [Myxococcales bacterium]|nr:formylglycine-generating enzyme family protein [Myxococcales bacterium]
EKPRHQVRLTEGYWLAETEVTQELWQAVMGDNPSLFTEDRLPVEQNPSRFTGERRPVEKVSWDDVQVFLAVLNNRMPGLQARLPTEAQWEYAARAGTEAPRYGPLDEVAWWDRNSDYTTHPVGTKVANDFGLYDMLGNVWEWCQDYWGRDEYGARAIPGTAIEDPTGPSKGGYRVVRGGGWYDGARNVRAAPRIADDPATRDSYFGLRLSRGP